MFGKAFSRGLMAGLFAAALAAPLLAGEAQVPQFKVDPLWPKQLPNNWAIGEIAGLAVDAQDNVWVIHRPRGLEVRDTRATRNPPTTPCCIPAPPVLAFNQAGDVVASWGGDGQGYDWPTNEHGVTVDGDGNVWILGNGNGIPGADGRPDRATADGMALKFTREGKFLLQIGGRGPAKDSLQKDRLSRASKVAVDTAANEVYIADGYVNHRIAVFDSETGGFKRMWGAYGKPPTDNPVVDGKMSRDQFQTVHCVVRSTDGLIYVCDRQHHRIQVFKGDGSFVTEFEYPMNNVDGFPGKVADLALWPDRAQSFLIIADGNAEQIRLVRRDDGRQVTAFGRLGDYAGQFNRLHVVTADAKGNIYGGEAGAKRVQKFVPTTGAP